MSIKRWVIVGILGMMIAFCCAQVYETPELLQYAMEAPTVQTEQDAPSEVRRMLTEIREISEQWTGIVSHTAVTADRENAMLTGVGGRAITAHLTGEYGSINALPARLMRAGRAFYPEEVENGVKVMILDEQLAIALFRVGDPIGRTVVLEETEYTVVGVKRHTRAAGDAAPYGAYVPLKALDAAGANMDTMTVWGKAVQGAGAQTKFRTDMGNWRPGGCFYSLSKERTRAVLPVWALVTLCMLWAVIACFKRFGQLILSLVNKYKERLKVRFAVQLTPYLIGYTAYGLLALCGALLLAYAWAKVLLWPVAVFPEWIPAVPVEANDILETWWQNAQTDCRLIEFRTREVLSLRRWRMLLRILSMAAVVACLTGVKQKKSL